jgi:hypothetical protein
MCIRSLRVHYLSALKWESHWLLMTQMENSRLRLLMPSTVLVIFFFLYYDDDDLVRFIPMSFCSLVLAMWVW